LIELTLIRPPVVHLKADFYGSIPGIPSGLAYLAASTRDAGFPVKIVDAYGLNPHRFYTFRNRYRARGLTPSETARLTPSGAVAGVSVHCAGEHSMACAIVRELKASKPQRPVVVGGYHSTFVPGDFIAAGADYVIMGEGERRLPALLSRIERCEGIEGLEGVAFRGGIVDRRTKYTVNLDSMPFAAVDLLPLENYWKLGYGHGPVMRNVRYMNILTSRGCPYKCSFCQAPEMSGGHWLSKSADRVLEEIRWHMDTYGVRDFHIQDENFAVNRKRVEDICRGIIEADCDITFCFPSGLKMETLDGELLRLLSSAGMRYFSLSPESGSRRVLELMNKTADIDRVPGLVKTASSLKVSTCCFFVAGTPGESANDRHDTRRYIRRLARCGVEEVVMPIMTPFPATQAMSEPGLQGFGEMDELCFSPVWRRDYTSLDLFRRVTYLHFYAARLFSHPLSFLAMLVRIVTGKCRTKGEMTARRMVRDILDRLSALGHPAEE